jgi:hypothetical protein
MSNVKLFESKQIRTVWSETDGKWYFVVEDVVSVLTESNDPKQYVKRMRQRDKELAKGWVQFVPTLWVETAGGKQKMGCANAKGPQNPKGFVQNKKAAKQGGAIAGNAWRELVSRIGEKVVTTDNYLPEAKKNKELKKGKEEK